MHMTAMILVDSNVLIDVWTDDPAWEPWSSQQWHASARSTSIIQELRQAAEAASGVPDLSPPPRVIVGDELPPP